MIFLSAEGLTKQYSENPLFKDLKLGINKGHKVGLIARNGAGKSTLLRILAGQDAPEEGQVHLRKGIKLGYLEQDPQIDNSVSIREFIDTVQTDLAETIRNYQLALEMQEKNQSEENQKVFEHVSAEMDAQNAWDYKRRLEQLLSRFNITGLHRILGTLSGGEKKRLAMAVTLLDDPDLLILDEPTNHLDVEMIEWLEQYLSKSSITLLMVTHDRYFLDRVCNHIMELDEGSLFHYRGNYAHFLEKKAEREANLQTEVHKAQQLMKKELEWLRRSPKARTTKSKSRIDAYQGIKEKAQTKTSKDSLRLEVKMSRVGGKIVEMHKVSKSFGTNLMLDTFSHTFKKGSRIGIVGPNGVGKSTFLNLVTGTLEADSGKIDYGATTVFGYYSQKGLVLNEDKRVLEVLTDIAEVITLGNGKQLTASQFLEYFLFPPKMQRTYYSRLSGGEKRRLYLLTVLIRNPNFLILDEPTNDLDLMTLNKLESFLENFKGCLLLVSHDRYFMDKLVDELLVFEGDGKVKSTIDSYSGYRETKAATSSSRVDKTIEKSPPKSRSTPVRKKLTYKERQEYQSLEKEIENLELEQEVLNQSLNQGSSDYSEIQKITERMGTLTQLIDEKTLRWLELDELS
ncbi:MAG: ABC transporter ATP-binding protein [Cyclobacteriaceae bacterium]|nr:MAG: ABC transporter ATP-binding protein [Cyclobacteriaceae bacterium]